MKGGFRSLLARWLGGASAGQTVPTGIPPLIICTSDLDLRIPSIEYDLLNVPLQLDLVLPSMNLPVLPVVEYDLAQAIMEMDCQA